MKHVLERFLLMYTDEVLETFARLPGAVVNKDYVFIPGTRKDRVLLVAHADTVTNEPPDSVEWNGNLASAVFNYRSASTVSTPADTKEEGALPAVEAAAGSAGTPYKEEPATRVQQTTSRALVEEDQDDAWEWKTGGYYSSGYSWYERCLGADDRAGIAILWLMRRSGHSLLITDGEEVGGTGAKAAVRDLRKELSKHQFALQIDRRYDQEMVFYRCSTPAFEKHMRKETEGYRIGIGSFTDISIICPAVGICGVNLSAGYWNEHSSEEMLSYDAWLRTFNVVHSMLWERTQPRFKLPRPAPEPQRSFGTSWWTDRTKGWSDPLPQPRSTPAIVRVKDEEVVAFAVNQMVFCREKCEDYVSIAKQDYPQGSVVKLRVEDLAEWDVCETCGFKFELLRRVDPPLSAEQVKALVAARTEEEFRRASGATVRVTKEGGETKTTVFSGNAQNLNASDKQELALVS